MGWFKGYLETMSPDDELTMEGVRLLEQLRGMLGERKIKDVWPVAIVLATKAQTPAIALCAMEAQRLNPHQHKPMMLIILRFDYFNIFRVYPSTPIKHPT